MAGFSEIKKERLKKLELLEKTGQASYPSDTKRTHTAEEAVSQFSQLSKSEKEIILAGRIRTIREHGGSTFFHLEDGTGMFQAYMKKDGVGEQSYQLFLDCFDIGDFIQVRGILFETKKGEKTLQVTDYRLLAKSLLPLPDKWHGLQDMEERFRKRYLDLIFNKDVKAIFATRAEITKAIRGFLEQEKFLEVETPVLQTMYGGADAQPFVTRINAFDMDMYLRISLELPLKRLIVGGFEKVYELGRVFRNEGVDRQHNPDFTMLEFYWAYADYKDMMRLTERMFVSVLQQVFGKTIISYEGKKLDFTTPWPRIEYADLFSQYAKIDISSMNRDALFKKAKELGANVEETFSKARIEDAIYKKVIRPNLWDPVFVIHHPAEMMPLAKQSAKDPKKAESFQLLAAGGWELVKAYSEQNVPQIQRKAFEEQEGLFRKGLEDAQRMDADFIEALEYGMPPTAGFGMGIDRLTTLLTDSHSLREVILFPTMKPKE